MTNTIEIENLNISDLDIPTDETLQEVATACDNIATSSESIATSCDNVATSCNSLAKDTTLQSTNTALGSLAADTTLQATNTALGGLNTALGGIIKDATGQSIDASVGSIATVLSDVATDTTLAGVAKDTTLQATNTALASLMADTTGQDIKDSLDDIKSAVQGLGTALGSDKANISGDNIASPATFRQNIGLTTGTTELILTIPAAQVFRQYIKKQYGVVYLYLDINNFKSTTAQTIGYLPEGYRPYHKILNEVIVINANDNSFKGYAHFTIETTGEITLQMQGNYNYPFCTLDVSFPISNT